MSLRMLEVFAPSEIEPQVRAAVEDLPRRGLWVDAISDDLTLVRVLLAKEQAEAVSDRLESRFGTREGFQVILLPVEAALPREAEPADAEAPSATAKPPERPPAMRVSRDELLADVQESLGSPRLHLAMALLSTVVCAVGLLRDNVAVLIGAMVLAPLLGPNVALALATTLGDTKLAVTALRIGLASLGTALALSMAVGLVVAVDPLAAEIAARTEVSFSDIVLALAAGSAGALVFTSGVPTALIGVMVAVALLPPVVALGLLVGSGQWRPAEGSLLLLLINVACVNLAGVVTFLIRGVRPRSWWDATRARKATRIAVIAWCVVLVILALLIVLVRQRGAGLPVE